MGVQTTVLLAALAGMSFAADAGAASHIRTNYEITLQSEGGTWTARSSADVVSGQPIEHDLNGYRLSLLPEIDASGRYTLEVSVGMAPRTSGAIHVPSRRTFPGQLGYPMEFEASGGGSTITGALMMDYVGD